MKQLGTGWTTSILLAWALSAACVPQTLRTASRDAAQERWAPAAAGYSAWLAEHPGHRRATRGLAEVLQPALRHHLDWGDRYARQGHWNEAVAEYEAGLAHLEAAEAAGLPLPAEAALLEEQAATAQASRRSWAIAVAEDRVAARDYEGALRVLADLPEHPDLERARAAARHAWGADLLAVGAYRRAADRFLAAGDAHGLQRADEVLAALGRWHLGAGHCRQAALDLTAAQHPAVAEERERARECATTTVQLVPLTLAPRSGELDRRATLAEALAMALSERPFLAVRDGEGADRWLAGTWTDGRVRTQEVGRQDSSAGTAFVECDEIDLCVVPAEVRWRDVVRSRVVELAVVMRTGSGGPLVRDEREFTVQVADRVHFAEGVDAIAAGRTVAVSEVEDLAVDVLALELADRPLRREEELVEEALRALVADIVAWADDRRWEAPADPDTLFIDALGEDQ